MATIDITKIKPNKVSTDPTSYSNLIAGIPKIGKSTLAKDLYGKKLLFIATEKRFGALDGANIQYVSNWAEFLMVMNQLKSPEAKEMFDSIAIDTLDNLVKYCEDFVMKHYDESELGEGKVGFGKDYKRAKDTFYRGLKMIENSGYNYCFITHVKEVTETIHLDLLTKEDLKLLDNNNNGIDEDEGTIEFSKKVPDIPDKYYAIVSKMVDNIIFADNFNLPSGESKRVLYLRGGIVNGAGVTLKDVPAVIPFSAETLKETYAKSLQGYENTTDEKKTHADTKETKYNFDNLMKQVVDMYKDFKEQDKMNIVNDIVRNDLGSSQKVGDLKPSQVEELALVVHDMALEHQKL